MSMTSFHRAKKTIYVRAYPGSEFVVANTLAKWKSWSQMNLTLAKVLAQNEYHPVVLYLTLCPLGATFLVC